jgi:bacterioferritin-associated ferredoxin
MYVCLCTGATSQAVNAAVERGARTTNQVAAECGAGIDCGRCRLTVQAIIAGADNRAAPACPARAAVTVCARD